MTDKRETQAGRRAAIVLGCGFWAIAAMTPNSPSHPSIISTTSAQQSAQAESVAAVAPLPAAPEADTTAPAPPQPVAPVAMPQAAPSKPSSDAQLAAAAIEQKYQASLSNARNMSQLLDRALDGRPSLVLGKANQPQKPAAPEIPTTPSSQVLQDVVKVLAPAVRACAKGQPGLAEMDIVVYRDGHVTSAKVTSPPFFKTPAGQCMEGVVRRAQFPRFTQRQFRVTVPFALK